MKQSPTYIHLRSQFHILGPDSPGQHLERKDFHDLMAKLNGKPVYADFDDFSYTPISCEMGKKRGKNEPGGGLSFSKLTYSDEQLTLVEEWASISASEFADKLIKVLGVWFAVFPMTVSITQKCCLRALTEVISRKDSREFIGNEVLKIGDALNHSFKVMPNKVGFSLSCLRREGIMPYEISANVQSWRDRKSVWIEVNGQKTMPQPLNPTNSDKGRELFNSCVDFLQDEVICFLATFDKRAGGEEGGEEEGGEQ